MIRQKASLTAFLLRRFITEFSFVFAFQEINENLNNDLAMVVTPVSNIKLDGMVQLRKELVRIARNKKLSPNVDINLPESWVKIELEIKRLRNTVGIPCLSMTELQEALKEKAIDVSECELRSCVSYLDAIGELQYFKVSLLLFFLKAVFHFSHIVQNLLAFF